MSLDFHTLHAELLQKKIFSPCSYGEQLWLSQTVDEAAQRLPEGLIIECGTMNASTAIIMASALMRVKEKHQNINIQSRVISVDSYMAHKKNEKLKSFEENLAIVGEFDFHELLTLVKADDIAFLRGLPDRSVSHLWVDSLHTKSHVSKTLEAALPKMIPGSLVCGHDYRYHNAGLIYAVEDWKDKHRDKLCGFGIIERVWWTIFRGGGKR